MASLPATHTAPEARRIPTRLGLSDQAAPEEAMALLDRILAGCAPDQLATLIATLSARLAAEAARRLVDLSPRKRQPDGHDENLSIDEAARRLGVSKDFLYRTKLPFKVRIGRRVLFSARGLERWNQARQGR